MEKDILMFAYLKEKEAAELYYKMSHRVKEPFVQMVFKDLAQEEEKHQEMIAKLQFADKKKVPEVPDLKISEILVASEIHPDMTLEEIIIYVIKMEEEAIQLYRALANATSDINDRALYNSLAKMESTHKYRFERVLQDIDQWRR